MKKHKIVTTKKKFKTRESIIAAIDRVQALCKTRSEEAERCGLEADSQFREAAKLDLVNQSKDIGTLIAFAQENRTKEKKLLKLNNRVPEKLESLKHTLAAFDTQLMPFETDNAVAMQK